MLCNCDNFWNQKMLKNVITYQHFLFWWKFAYALLFNTENSVFYFVVHFQNWFYEDCNPFTIYILLYIFRKNENLISSKYRLLSRFSRYNLPIASSCPDCQKHFVYLSVSDFLEYELKIHSKVYIYIIECIHIFTR